MFACTRKRMGNCKRTLDYWLVLWLENISFQRGGTWYFGQPYKDINRWWIWMSSCNVWWTCTLTPRGASHVYQVSSSNRGQITILACIGAAGDVLAPMKMFPGKRFNYDPLEASPEAYLVRSDNGWMDSDLFYMCLKLHFLPHVTKKKI